MSSVYQSHRIALGLWLLFCAAVVYAMIVVGGVTRLTDSGLSMVDWQPIMGILPPLTEQEWLRVFEQYKAFPEYQLINRGMSVEEFKSIFWWEYGHRVLGRSIGVIYLLPLLFFYLKGMVPAGWHIKLASLFVLGGLQGLMGWYMVKSGLVDVPHVSQYRLTAHLGLALVIFAAMFWFALDFLRGDISHGKATAGYRLATAVVVVAVFVMMLSGGFVAGTKAGHIMNTFPLMGGRWVPEGVLAMQPAWRNLFENSVTIQFVHRCLAVFVLLSVLGSTALSRLQQIPTGANWVLLIMVLQITLGITTLIYAVPVALGAAHQAGAVALLAASLYAAHLARKY